MLVKIYGNSGNYKFEILSKYNLINLLKTNLFKTKPWREARGNED